MMVRVIDIETTGIDPAKDAIVEVASVDLTHEKAITNKQETLVRPGIGLAQCFRFHEAS